MGLSCLSTINTKWLTLLQPVPVVVEDSVDVVVVVAAEEAVDVVVNVDVAVERTKLNGYQSPNWAVWSVMARSSRSRRSTSSLFPSKNLKSSTSSWDRLLRTKCSRSCLSRNRPVLDNVPASRLSLPLVITTDTLVWESSARKKLPPPPVVPSSWLSCQSSRSVVVTGETKLVSPTLSLQGYRQMRFLLGTSDSRPPWYWYRVCPSPQETSSDGWY